MHKCNLKSIQREVLVFVPLVNGGKWVELLCNKLFFHISSVFIMVFGHCLQFVLLSFVVNFVYSSIEDL
jgi:hypothetical protein